MPNTTITAKPIGALLNLASRLFQPPQDNIRGIENNSWYSPLNPVTPLGPPDGEPKGFQFWAGQNLMWTPRPDAEYSAWDLKDMATYPLARICIENVKDSINRIPWQVQLKKKPGEGKKDLAERAKGNADLIKINTFFERPDREHAWDEWLRPLIEDMLVIDAGSIYVRKTFSGKVAELVVGRGEMFTRYIDDNGLTPVPPSPAYAQIWWGMPLVNMTTEQLIYKPRSIVPRSTISSNLYGMSPVEQLAEEIQIGQARLDFVKAYYTNGSIPDVVQVVPASVPPGKIREAMEWMNSELAGNLAARRQWRMVQGFAEEGKPDQIFFTKEKLLTDAFDEFHVRKMAFGLYTSPQRLMRMMGTRNAQQQQEATENESLIPLLEWVRIVRDHITQVTLGYPDFENTYDAEREPDPAKQATRLKTLISCGALTINQAAEELGNEPFDVPECDEPGIITATGFVPVGADTQLEQQQTLGTDAESQHKRGLERMAAKPKQKPPAGPGSTQAQGKQTGKEKPNGKTAHMHFGAVLDVPDLEKGFAATLVKPVINPSALTPHAQLAKRRMEASIHNMFSRMHDIVLRAMLAKFVKSKQNEQQLTEQIMQELESEWDLLPDEIEDALAQAGMGGVSLGGLQLSITDRGMLDVVNQTAQDWARKRAAELVGRRRLEDGTLIENPNSKWAITESTRDKLQIIVRDLFAEDHPSLHDVEERIIEAGIFSDTRASMIARTEISLAQSHGNLEAWKASGKVATVEWQLSGNHDLDDECDENADGGPYDVDEVPDCPAHPNCDCVLVLGQFTDEVEE